jgi:two-component system, LytTR family, response regulator
MLNCIAIDDEPLALDIIETFAKQINSIVLTKSFTQPTKAAQFLKHNHCDLLFMDIQMPDINGIELVQLIGNEKLVIFTTAFRKYAVDGFDLNAVDFLVKPFSFDRFKLAIEKAEERFKNKINETEPDSLYVHVEYNLVKISLHEIEYIECLGDYIKIVITSKKPILTLMPMKTVLEKLGKNFVRIHRSFIIPIHKINTIKNRNVIIENREIPIGTTYKKGFKNLPRK